MENIQINQYINECIYKLCIENMHREKLNSMLEPLSQVFEK